MRKWTLLFLSLPALVFSAPPPNQGKSLYGSDSQQGQVPNCSHLTYEEQTFAAKLSSIHKSIFCQQFSPQQRQDAMRLAKLQDPLNTTAGKISPDHAVEVILQSSRDSNQATSESSQSNQNMGERYQPKNQQPSPYYPPSEGGAQNGKYPYDGCKRY